ncbi:hypothetical protein PoB_002932900 [Plakobranchus ocellatus]|uniref:Uncharacterized protein n=1 Tax=Plakobranchus ocellatus TaxID=259542 RepID=A0AAV4A567_9GAST|nr:hypothetical protein PoB_002932900 [Plakobranchus ocellatus]
MEKPQDQIFTYLRTCSPVKEELEAAIKKMKNGKATGPDIHLSEDLLPPVKEELEAAIKKMKNGKATGPGIHLSADLLPL